MTEAMRFDNLTPRHAEILELASRGLQNRQVARAIGVSASTVTSHTTVMLLGLGLTGEKMPRAVSLACQAGYFKEPLDIDEPVKPLELPELLAVYCLAEGLSVEMDAEIRGKTVSAVQHQRDRARKKVEASTLPSLVRRAYQLELLPLSAPWIEAQIAAHPATSTHTAQDEKGHGSSQFDKLTNRQKEVLDLASKGLRNIQVARALGIAPRTVERHTATMLLGLGLTGKPMSKAVSLACQTGHFKDPLPIDRPAQSLKKPELLAVHYLAKGYTALEDAETRNTSEKSVITQRDLARSKVGALTLPHLVRCAYQLEILPLRAELLETQITNPG